MTTNLSAAYKQVLLYMCDNFSNDRILFNIDLFKVNRYSNKLLKNHLASRVQYSHDWRDKKWLDVDVTKKQRKDLVMCRPILHSGDVTSCFGFLYCRGDFNVLDREKFRKGVIAISPPHHISCLYILITKEVINERRKQLKNCNKLQIHFY